MTDTTDIKALRSGLTEQLDHMECYGGKGWISQEDIRSILDSLNMLEAERQRAEDLQVEVDRVKQQSRNRLQGLCKAGDERDKAEEELTALKGEQVPVAYLIHEKAKPARLSFQNLKGFVSQSDIEEHELWQEELFTAPQKPVVLPELPQLFKEAIAWGRVYGPTMGKELWFEMLETQASNFSTSAAGGKVES